MDQSSLALVSPGEAQGKMDWIGCTCIFSEWKESRQTQNFD